MSKSHAQQELAKRERKKERDDAWEARRTAITKELRQDPEWPKLSGFAKMTRVGQELGKKTHVVECVKLRRNPNTRDMGVSLGILSHVLNEMDKEKGL
jgi:hypothetical protein